MLLLIVPFQFGFQAINALGIKVHGGIGIAHRVRPDIR
jgi:hypothetical protein